MQYINIIYHLIENLSSSNSIIYDEFKSLNQKKFLYYGTPRTQDTSKNWRIKFFFVKRIVDSFN